MWCVCVCVCVTLACVRSVDRAGRWPPSALCSTSASLILCISRFGQNQSRISPDHTCTLWAQCPV